jgi:hypothetical protein
MYLTASLVLRIENARPNTIQTKQLTHLAQHGSVRELQESPRWRISLPET